MTLYLAMLPHRGSQRKLSPPSYISHPIRVSFRGQPSHRQARHGRGFPGSLPPLAKGGSHPPTVRRVPLGQALAGNHRSARTAGDVV